VTPGSSPSVLTAKKMRCLRLYLYHEGMWHGFGHDITQQLAIIKQLTALRHQTPTKEWPLVVIEESGELLVVREWPDGQVTAYTCSENSGAHR
jgi:hypothetical protein